MSERITPSGRDSRVVAKAGIWYTICNFLFRGMAFITTPFFSRLMSKSELGNFSNFASWTAILMVVTSLDLAQSIIRSKLEHDDDIDSYIWSILVFSTIWTVIVYAFFLIFPSLFSEFFGIEEKYLHIMFLYLLMTPAYTMLITKQRAYYHYKMFVLITGVITVISTLLALLLVFLMENKLTGRIVGYYMPYVVFGLAIFVFLAFKGKTIKIKYWKYAIAICLPLVPHVLSMYLLSSSDLLIIKRISGAEYAAVYSIAYSAYHISTILFDSMNKAWAPWLLDSLHEHNYSVIRETSKKYIGAFETLIIGLLLLIPEIILILGGRQYLDAVYCLPPLIASCMFQFIYTMYVNIEFYEKKTIGVSVATMLATAINIILNLILIPMNPEHGYIIAAYTTLVGYAVLFFMHFFIVKKMRMTHVYDTGFILIVLAVTLFFALLMNWIYELRFVRYGLLLIYLLLMTCSAVRYKDSILAIIKTSKRT